MIAGLLLAYPVWYLVSPIFIDLEEANEVLVLTEEAVEKGPVFSGTFERIDYDVSGTFEIFEESDKYVLNIEGLDVTNGPDLHFVLSNERAKSLDKNEYIELSELKQRGTFSVDLPKSTDIGNYKYLHIHCVQFNHAFAGAEIESSV